MKKKKETKMLFNFRIHSELYDYLSKTSKEKYTTMSQYLIDIITNDKDNSEGGSYVYVYLDPRKKGKFNYGALKFDYEPFYVGKGTGNRITTSLDDANNNEDKQEIIDEIFNCNLKPISIKINSNLSDERAYEIESKLIEKIGRLYEGSVLTNRSKGHTTKIKSVTINRKYNLKKIDYEIFSTYLSDGRYELIDGSLISEKLFLDIFEPGEDELYYLRSNNKYVVSILDRDDTYFDLSDGSKIPQILFFQTFKMVEKVNPEEFFNTNKSPIEKMWDLGKETPKNKE